jgi:hypothetical protein
LCPHGSFDEIAQHGIIPAKFSRGLAFAQDSGQNAADVGLQEEELVDYFSECCGLECGGVEKSVDQQNFSGRRSARVPVAGDDRDSERWT